MIAIRTRSSSGNDNANPDAKQALARMKRAGHAVNPLDPDHTRAYIMLRQQRGTVDGATMVEYLERTTSQTKQHVGGSTTVEYWGVPKTNFDGKPPTHWGESLMHPDTMAMLESVGGQQINWTDYFVVDQEIPRKGLGCHVVTYAFYANSNCTRKPTNNGKAITATGPEPAVGGSAGPAIGGPEPAIGGSVHPAIDGPEPARGGSVHPAIGHLEPAIGGSVLSGLMVMYE